VAVVRENAANPSCLRRRFFILVYGKGQEVDVLFRKTTREELVREVSHKSRDLAMPFSGSIGDRRSIDLENLFLVGLGVEPLGFPGPACGANSP
jgi:hypothetical protein